VVGTADLTDLAVSRCSVSTFEPCLQCRARAEGVRHRLKRTAPCFPRHRPTHAQDRAKQIVPCKANSRGALLSRISPAVKRALGCARAHAESLLRSLRRMSEIERLLEQSEVVVAADAAATFDRLAEDSSGPIVLFGAGGLGRKMLTALVREGVPVAAISDNNESLHGKTIEGVPVISPADAITRYGADGVFVVTIFVRSGLIRSQLMSAGVKTVVPFHALAWKYPRYLLPHYSRDLPQKIIANGADVMRGYLMLADDVSRDEYLAQLRWRFDPDVSMPEAANHDIYFAPGISDLTDLRRTTCLVRLGGMTTLMQAFPGVPVGLSDHTVDNYSAYAAVALGASIIEKHFTDHKGRQGPDIVCSMDEHACGELITASRIIRSELGGAKEAAQEEGVTIDFAFASVVPIAPVSKGERFSESNLWVKRPGKDGIPAEQYETILGRRATRAIPADLQLQPGDYE